MTARLASPHELACAAREAAIAHRRVAHHSGAADDYYRRVTSRLRQPPVSTAARSVPVEIVETSDGRWRAIVDQGDAGLWDHIVPADVAREILLREAAPCKS